MGLAGDRDIVIGKTINLARHFLGADNDEDLLLRPDLLDHVRQVQAVHGEVDDRATVCFPLLNAGAPLHVVFAEELPAPAFDNIGDALHNAFVRCGKVHPTGAQCPGREPDMGGHALVPLGPVTDPENCGFVFGHGIISSL